MLAKSIEAVEQLSPIQQIIAYLETVAAIKTRVPYKEVVRAYPPFDSVEYLKSEEVPRGQIRWITSAVAIARGCDVDSTDLTIEYMNNIFQRTRKLEPGDGESVVILGQTILLEGQYVKVRFDNASLCEELTLVINGGAAETYEPFNPVIAEEEAAAPAAPEEIFYLDTGNVYVSVFTKENVELYDILEEPPELNDPVGVTIDENFIYVLDYWPARVYIYFHDGTYTGVYFDVLATDPGDITCDSEYFYILQTSPGPWPMIFKYTKLGAYVDTYFPATWYSGIRAITCDDTFLYLFDRGDYTIKKVNKLGLYIGVQCAIPDGLDYSWGLTTDGVKFYSWEKVSKELWVFSMSGVVENVFPYSGHSWHNDIGSIETWLSGVRG